jgi:hypothetical protein
MKRSLALTGLLAAFALGACSNPNALAKASVPNVLDTLTLWSLRGGPLQKPTAYSLPGSGGVRTYDGGTWEFAFSIEPARGAVFIPLAALGLSPSGSLKPGLIASTALFDAMTKAPLNGYITDDTVGVNVGDRFFVRSRLVCAALGVPQYGKLEVLALDTTAKSITFQTVSDNNCGYRGVRLGIPTE